jgi:hypothetical protein
MRTFIGATLMQKIFGLALRAAARRPRVSVTVLTLLLLVGTRGILSAAIASNRRAEHKAALAEDSSCTSNTSYSSPSWSTSWWGVPPADGSGGGAWSSSSSTDRQDQVKPRAKPKLNP